MQEKIKSADVLSVAEVQQRLGLSRNVVYDSLASGRIPSLRFGRRILIPRAAFERMLAGDAPAPLVHRQSAGGS